MATTTETDKFLNLIQELINQSLDKMDQTSLCIVQSVNNDGSLNIYFLSDKNTIVYNIINASKYTFAPGDGAILYKIKNQVGNAFVIAKYNP